MSKPKRTVPNSLQIVAANEILKNVCILIDGHAVYEDGWSDARVMNEINTRFPNHPLSLTSVQKLRRDFVGEVRKPRNDSHVALVQRLERLERWAAARPREPFKMEAK